MSDDNISWKWTMPAEPFDPEVPWGHHPTTPPWRGGWHVLGDEARFPEGLRAFFWFERLRMGAIQNVDEHLDLLLAVLDALHSTGPEMVHATAARKVIGYEGYWQHYMCWICSQRLCIYSRHPLHQLRLTDEGHAVRLMLRMTSMLLPHMTPRLGMSDRRDVPVLGLLTETRR